MKQLDTVFYDEVDHEFECLDSMLVFRDRLDLTEFETTVFTMHPRVVIPPWDSNQAWTSRAWDRADALFSGRAGLVIVEPDIPFLLWAMDNSISPLVLLPSRRSAMHRLLEFQFHHYLCPGMWFHIPGDYHRTVTEDTFPDIRFTTGRDFSRETNDDDSESAS